MATQVTRRCVLFTSLIVPRTMKYRFEQGISLGTALIKAFEVSRLKHTEGLLRSFFATARGRLLREVRSDSVFLDGFLPINIACAEELIRGP